MNNLGKVAATGPAESKPSFGAGQSRSPGRSRTAHEYVLRALREAIVDGQMPGGTRIIQSEIAGQLEVSVTPVREALRDLAAEGLVVFDPHRGALVRSLDLEEVREVYELRMVLEPLLVRRSVEKISSEQIDRADWLRTAMEATESITAWAELNRQFHEALALPGESSKLSSIIAGLRDSASAFVGISLRANPERLAQSNDEHARLVELYRRREVDAVVNLTLEHLRTTLTTIEEGHQSGIL